MSTKSRRKVAEFFYCEDCDYSCFEINDFTKHINTKKHLSTESVPSSTKSRRKVAEFFHCEDCDYSCFKMNDFNKHLQTKKHLSTESTEKVSEKFVCTCGNSYKDRSGLWRHKKACKKSPEVEIAIPTEINIYDENKVVKTEEEISQMTALFMESIKQNQEILMKNQEFQEKLFEMMKDNVGTINSHNIITTNNNNNKFNLNLFLNETCKDAMNLSEFVDTLQVTLDDLENIGKLGYAEGISRIFTNGLKAIDINRRPIHCSDLKRETVYVKNNNVWEKEGDQLRKAIKLITNRNIKLIPKWKDANPGHHQYHNKRNDDYLKIMYESMGPTDELEEKKLYGKIITNLAKETVILK